MTDAEKKARFIELNKKLQSGVPLTAAEQAELKSLLSSAPELQPGYIPLKTPEQAKAEFDAMRAKAAAEETARQRARADAAAGAVPAVKPEDMQVNPDLLLPLQAPATPTPPTPVPTAAPPKATPEQPIPAAPVTTPTAQPNVDAAAGALVDQNPQPGETDDERAERAERLAKAAKDPDFKDKLQSVSKNWGLSILEALQAGMLGYIGGATGNWQKSAYQLRMEKEERAKATEEERAARAEEMKAQDERLQKQLSAAAEQAALDRAASAIALDKQLTMQEKIAKLQAYQRSHGMAITPDAAAVDLLAGE